LKELGLSIPIVCLSHEPSRELSTVDMKVVARCQSYITINGQENLVNLFRYIGKEVFGLNLDVKEPEPVPWEGLYHPDALDGTEPVPPHSSVGLFTDVEDYLEWYKPKDAPTVGILLSRYYWVNGEMAIEDFLIRQLESQGLNVIPVFSYSSRDKGLGTKGSGEVILEYFLKQDGTPRIDALVKLLTFFLGRRKDEELEEKENAQRGVEILKTLGVPVFQPVVSYYKTIDEWREDAQGLSSEISWSIAMPEFEGVIEPIIIGGPIKAEEKETGNIIQSRQYIEERCAKLVHRVKKWIELKRKQPEERKVAFILHNNPCASVEASVGVGAHLDTLESVARILNRMKTEGYNILEPPEDGRQLIQTIMERKAISEFSLNAQIEASKEMDSLLNGFEGRYIPAGPSGLITRGRADVLPTGRNFYSLDPRRVPTKAAWKVGQRFADALIEKHRAEEGKLPENVAIYWMVSDIIWADGEGMAQMMSLIGVEPTWQPNGRIDGFRIIPLEELGRPRIDLTVRVSGITRDNFQNCIELMDEAIQAVASLDEPLEMNFIRKHALEQMPMESGMTNHQSPITNHQPEAWRQATLRIFSSKPGTYSAGVQLAVYASAWKEEKDLSDIFVYWNGYAYGKGIFGQESHQQLINSLRTVDVTYNKVVSDEYDLFGCCCYFGAHGGLTAAAKTISQKPVKTYYGDTREVGHVEVKDLADEIRRVVRTKLINPKWIEGMKRHGYKGASDISKRIGRVYGWESTTSEVDDWIFDEIASTFVLDEENRRFFEQNNPWALEEIARRLLEANERGLWQADQQVLEELKNLYMEIEGWLEEKMGDVDGDFQGGMVDILTAEDIDDWNEKMREVREKLSKW
jgi:cobalamin biosynthesis Mg chelatase CobN